MCLLLSDTKIGFFVEYSYLCEDVIFLNMKIKVFIAALLAVILTAGCADIRRLEDLKIESVEVENISPRDKSNRLAAFIMPMHPI